MKKENSENMGRISATKQETEGFVGYGICTKDQNEMNRKKKTCPKMKLFFNDHAVKRSAEV